MVSQRIQEVAVVMAFVALFVVLILAVFSASAAQTIPVIMPVM